MTDLPETSEFEMGLDVGIYLIAGLMAEGYTCTQRGWEFMKDHKAHSIEAMTGTPAEDFALMMQPFVDMLVRGIEQYKEQHGN